MPKQEFSLADIWTLYEWNNVVCEVCTEKVQPLLI